MARRAAPVSPSPIALSCSDLLFVNEYLRNGQNGSKAYRTVHPHVTSGSADVGAHRTLRRAKVQEELARRLRYDAGITRDFVSARLLEYEDMAHEHKDYVAGASIAMDAARLGGFITEKREVKTVSDEDSSAIRSLVSRTFVTSPTLRMAQEDHTPSLSHGPTQPLLPVLSDADASAATVKDVTPLGVDATRSQAASGTPEERPPHPTADGE